MQSKFPPTPLAADPTIFSACSGAAVEELGQGTVGSKSGRGVLSAPSVRGSAEKMPSQP